MSKSDQGFWEEIFKQYKASGLSQAAFCGANNLSNNQFHYRWREHNKARKAETGNSQFESVLSQKGYSSYKAYYSFNIAS